MDCRRCGGEIRIINIAEEGFEFCDSCHSFNVLDRGFIALVDFMGGDLQVVKSARVSRGKDIKTEDEDRRLINFMMRHGHGSPFEHSVFIFHVKLPIFVARQWMRHRMCSYNEKSGRAVEFQDEFYIPSGLRAQEGKQSSHPAKFDPELVKLIENATKSCYESYKKLIEAGVAKELARIILPINLYTEFYWTINARSLMNFLNQRCSEDAQWEIREYATRTALIFREKMPWTFSAFLEYGFTGNSRFLESVKSAQR